MFPKRSKFIKINTNDKVESAILDKLLDGTSDELIGLDGVGVPVNELEIKYLTVSGNIVFVIVSPVQQEIDN